MGLGLGLRHFLEKFYEPITIILNLGLVLSGVWLHASLEHWPTLITSAALMLLLGLLDLFLKRLHDRTKARSTYETYLVQLLEAAAVSMLRAVNPPSPHIRANLMLLDDHEKRLNIKYSYGFDHYVDRDLEILIPVGTGCAGYAFMKGEAVIADVTVLSRPTGMPVHWGLPPAEISKVRPSLKSIFSIPFNFGINHKYSAILNFDSDNTISEMRFDDPNIQKIAYCHVQTFQAFLTDMFE
jgi:hypothetical protein